MAVMILLSTLVLISLLDINNASKAVIINSVTLALNGTLIAHTMDPTVTYENRQLLCKTLQIKYSQQISARTFSNKADGRELLCCKPQTFSVSV